MRERVLEDLWVECRGRTCELASQAHPKQQLDCALASIHEFLVGGRARDGDGRHESFSKGREGGGGLASLRPVKVSARTLAVTGRALEPRQKLAKGRQAKDLDDDPKGEELCEADQGHADGCADEVRQRRACLWGLDPLGNVESARVEACGGRLVTADLAAQGQDAPAKERLEEGAVGAVQASELGKVVVDVALPAKQRDEGDAGVVEEGRCGARVTWPPRHGLGRGGGEGECALGVVVRGQDGRRAVLVQGQIVDDGMDVVAGEVDVAQVVEQKTHKGQHAQLQRRVRGLEAQGKAEKVAQQLERRLVGRRVVR